MGKSKIEWTDAVWNPVTGCTKVSAGCKHCYAERMSKRLAGRVGYPEAPDNFKVTLHPDRLDEPLNWHKPRRVFVCSMGDLFHKDVPDNYVSDVLDVVGFSSCARHTFMILTKRPERMYKFFAENPGPTIPNLWLGTSVENQPAADERIPWLLQTPAAVRFLSCEPLLGAVNIENDLFGRHFVVTGPPRPGLLGPEMNKLPKLDWVIVGGESGPGARPMHPDWALSLRNQCFQAGVPLFFKQWGEWLPVGDEYTGDAVTQVFDGQRFARVGKHAAGHMIGGREWHDYPEVTSERE